MRKQVIERKNWAKFGDVKHVEKGKHLNGDYLEGTEVRIETLDSNHKEEINIVMQLEDFVNNPGASKLQKAQKEI